MSSLLGHAPVEQQLPVLMLAAIHFLLLDETDHPLAAWYPNITDDHRDPDDAELAATLQTFIDERSAAILEILGSRRVQTNEVGRCALFLPAFAEVAADIGALAHVDVGTSAGLNLLLPHYSYRYDSGEWIGSSVVDIECSTRGAGPRATAVPDVVSSVGIDSRPIDATDPVEARWLEACCWPDQADRFERLRAAIGIASDHPPRIVEGDAVDTVGSTVAEMDEQAHPVVTTSWVLNYLAPADRHRFVSTLDDIGADIDLSWVIAESPAQTPELPHPGELAGAPLGITSLTLVTWRNGQRSVRPLGTCHPHGYWIHWLEGDAVSSSSSKV